MAVEATLSSFSFQMTSPGNAVQPSEPVFHIAYELNDSVLGDLGIRVVKVQEDDFVDEILALLDQYVGSLATASKIPNVKVRALPRKAERQRLRAEQKEKDPSKLSTDQPGAIFGGS